MLNISTSWWRNRSWLLSGPPLPRTAAQAGATALKGRLSPVWMWSTPFRLQDQSTGLQLWPNNANIHLPEENLFIQGSEHLVWCHSHDTPGDVVIVVWLHFPQKNKNWGMKLPKASPEVSRRHVIGIRSFWFPGLQFSYFRSWGKQPRERVRNAVWSDYSISQCLSFLGHKKWGVTTLHRMSWVSWGLRDWTFTEDLVASLLSEKMNQWINTWINISELAISNECHCYSEEEPNEAYC